MRGDASRAFVQIDPIQCLTHFQAAADEPIGSAVADAVNMHIAFGIHDAAIELIDLGHVQRQPAQVRLLEGE